jgi:hypothetical protein
MKNILIAILFILPYSLMADRKELPYSTKLNVMVHKKMDVEFISPNGESVIRTVEIHQTMFGYDIIPFTVNTQYMRQFRFDLPYEVEEILNKSNGSVVEAQSQRIIFLKLRLDDGSLSIAYKRKKYEVTMKFNPEQTAYLFEIYNKRQMYLDRDKNYYIHMLNKFYLSGGNVIEEY